MRDHVQGEPLRKNTTLALMELIARTDRTFEWTGMHWRGKCLICNGWLQFDPRIGVGANIEHTVPRSRGGSSDPRNLGLTHPRCNYEKGVHWDNKRARRGRNTDYQSLVERLLAKRAARWREPEEAEL